MRLREVCRSFGPQVPPLTHDGEPVEGGLVLWAFAGVESSYGTRREFARIEPAYQPGGGMYRQSEKVRALWRRYGALAACSFGTWQMMATTAQDLGHGGHPVELQMDTTLAPLVIHYLMRSQATTLREAADAYNSGTQRDKFVPEAYIQAVTAAYVAGWDRGPQEG
jgi:hypothetical protein